MALLETWLNSQITKLIDGDFEYFRIAIKEDLVTVKGISVYIYQKIIKFFFARIKRLPFPQKAAFYCF
jgi:hypothetical protein